MAPHDARSVSWLARFGRLRVPVPRYRCPNCPYECRPLLDVLGVEPGRVTGSLARLLALLASIAPYPLAARLAWLLLGVTISPMGIWRVTQRLGQAAAVYSDELSRYHADSRSAGARSEEHTSELQSPDHLVCRLLLEKKKNHPYNNNPMSMKNRLRTRPSTCGGVSSGITGFEAERPSEWNAPTGARNNQDNQQTRENA